MIEKTFGIKKTDAIYKERIGAYGIGFSADGKIPVAMTHLYNGEKGYFLLGGGIFMVSAIFITWKLEILFQNQLNLTTVLYG